MDIINKETEYMTVGEIAAKAGVTVRTVQYYDQKGLLTPSAKGSRNLRLYTPQDLERLYRILCYKFLGLPLDEIRRQEGEELAPREVTKRLRQKIREAEESLSEQMKRYAVLRNLEDFTDRHQVSGWEAYADLIDCLQEKWKLIWEVNYLEEDGILPAREKEDDGDMTSYYRIAAETIRLMREGIPPQSQEAMKIAADLAKMRQARDAEENAQAKRDLLHIDPKILETKSIDFSGFWNEIIEYLKAAREYFEENK